MRGRIGYGKVIIFNWTDTEPELGFGGLSVFGAMSLQLAFAVNRSEGMLDCSGCGKLYSQNASPERASGDICDDVRRNWDDLGVIDRDVSDSSRSHYGATHEVHGSGPDRFRFRFRVVWLSSMADRRVLALPDSGRLAQEVRVSGIDCRCQTEILGLNSAKLYGIKGVV